MKYDIYLVPNGRLADFEKGYLGTGYPDACQCWGMDMTVDECRARFAELAEENFRREGGEYDDLIAEADDLEDGTIDCSKAEAALKEYVEGATRDADPLNWAIEWNNDLKWVRCRVHEEP